MRIIRNSLSSFCVFSFLSLNHAQAVEPPSKKIIMAEIEHTKELVEKYPFLSELVKDSAEMDKEINAPAPATFSTAQIPSENGGKELLFVGISGSAYCGSLGCQLSAYIKNDTGYKESFGVVTGAEIRLINNKTETTIILCTGPNGSVWTLKGDEFEHIEGTNDQTPHPACAEADKPDDAPVAPKE